MTDTALIDDILTSRRSPENPPVARADRAFEVFSQAAGAFLYDLLPDLLGMVRDWHHLPPEAKPNGIRSVLGANECLTVATAQQGTRAVILNAHPSEDRALAVALEGRTALDQDPARSIPDITRVIVFRTWELDDGPTGFAGRDQLWREADRLVREWSMAGSRHYLIHLDLRTPPEGATDRRVLAMQRGRLRSGAKAFERLADLVEVGGGDLRQTRADT